MSNRVSRRQANRWAADDQSVYQQAYASTPTAYAPAPAAAPAQDDMYQQLQQLADLHAQGILTDEEFAAQKARILNS